MEVVDVGLEAVQSDRVFFQGPSDGSSDDVDDPVGWRSDPWDGARGMAL